MAKNKTLKEEIIELKIIVKDMAKKLEDHNKVMKKLIGNGEVGYFERVRNLEKKAKSFNNIYKYVIVLGVLTLIAVGEKVLPYILKLF